MTHLTPGVRALWTSLPALSAGMLLYVDGVAIYWVVLFYAWLIAFLDCLDNLLIVKQSKVSCQWMPDLWMLVVLFLSKQPKGLGHSGRFLTTM